MPHRRPRQLDPSLYIGRHRIFLTMCTFDRQRVFLRQQHVDEVRTELLRTGESYRVEVTAYCFMPDHCHALLEGLAFDSELLKCIKMFRQRSGHAYRARTSERLWQDGYFDRFLRSDQATLDAARYIVANLLRANLCADARQYPHLGSGRYTLDELLGSLA